MTAPDALQLALPLPEAATSYDPADLIEDAANAEARAWLDRPGDWPFGRLALSGAAQAGKTHLLAWAAARHGWHGLPGGGPALRGLPGLPAAATGVVLDEADRVAEEAALFHLINLCAERRLPLLLAGREAPARWPVALPDLRSRLRGTTAVALRPPGDALLDALLAKHFTDRQLRVDAAFRAWLLAWLPRDPASLAMAASRLDRAALALGGRITRPLARAVLADLPGVLPGDDASVAAPMGSSPAEARLL
jgi:chromosomal replication initiation ATPase DnaA